MYVCLRPVRWFTGALCVRRGAWPALTRPLAGVPSPVKNPASVNMVIFRENTEDIYAGAHARRRRAERG